MLITVARLRGDAQATPGLLSLNGVYECRTLEPRRDQSQGKPYCIPAATYDYVVGASDHFDRNVIKVLNVPGFTGIELHPGNYPKDTHGCCLVGRTFNTDFVGQSEVEYDALMGKIPPVGQIEYVDPVPQEDYDAT